MRSMALFCFVSRAILRSNPVSRLCWSPAPRVFSTDGPADNDVELPPPPKRPLSSYIEFSSQKRPVLIQANPGIKLVDISKMTGELWRRLPDDEKQPYVTQAKTGLVSYRQQMEDYLNTLTPEQRTAYFAQQDSRKQERQKLQQRRQRIKTKQMLRELSKPQKVDISSYLCYCREQNYMAHSDLKITERMQRLAQQWKELPDHDKLVYNARAEANRTDYQTALADWEQRMKEEGHPEFVRGYKPPKPAKKPKKKVQTKAKKSSKKGKKKAAKKKTKSSTQKGDSDEPKSTRKRKPKVDEDTSWMREE